MPIPKARCRCSLGPHITPLRNTVHFVHTIHPAENFHGGKNLLGSSLPYVQWRIRHRYRYGLPGE